MKPFNFAEEAKKAEGNTFKLKEGNNVIRIVSEFLLDSWPSKFDGKPGRKFVGFLIDRADGAIKPAWLAKNVMDQIANYQLTPDYAFDGVPLPYDINIFTKNAGKLDVVYTVQPARKNTPLSDAEKAAVDKLDLKEFVENLQNDDETPAEQLQSAIKKTDQTLVDLTEAQKNKEFQETFGPDVTADNVPV